MNSDAAHDRFDVTNSRHLATTIFLIFGFAAALIGIGLAVWSGSDKSSLAGVIVGLGSALIAVAIGFAQRTKIWGSASLVIVVLLALVAFLGPLAGPQAESYGVIIAGIGTGLSTLAILIDIYTSPKPKRVSGSSS